jgi:hypothetical protein
MLNHGMGELLPKKTKSAIAQRKKDGLAPAGPHFDVKTMKRKVDEALGLKKELQLQEQEAALLQKKKEAEGTIAPDISGEKEAGADNVEDNDNQDHTENKAVDEKGEEKEETIKKAKKALDKKTSAIARLGIRKGAAKGTALANTTPNSSPLKKPKKQVVDWTSVGLFFTQGKFTEAKQKERSKCIRFCHGIYLK